MTIRTTNVIGDVTNDGKDAVGQTAPASVIQTVGLPAIGSSGNRGKILGVAKFCPSSAILHDSTPPSLRTCYPPVGVKVCVYPCGWAVPAPSSRPTHRSAQIAASRRFLVADQNVCGITT